MEAAWAPYLHPTWWSPVLWVTFGVPGEHSLTATALGDF